MFRLYGHLQVEIYLIELTLLTTDSFFFRILVLVTVTVLIKLELL
jgi:hypothetical protein